ncbi:MAG: hypothetical protein SFY70_11755 [Bacteroidia bacterium]|nr:hypothetical protein [Bacteroidia bacterium]
MKQLVLTFATSLVLLSACSDDTVPPTPLAGAVVVLNEGNFQDDNAEISALASTGAVANDLFGAINSRPLGDVLQSAAVIGTNIYLVVNNSNKIEVINRETGRSVATISGLQQPRYILQVSPTKAYVTEWVGLNPDFSFQDGNIAIVDLTTYSVTGRIEAIGPGPEQLVLAEGTVYVGTASSSRTALWRVDPTTDVLLSDLDLDQSPASLTVSRDTLLWALCPDPNLTAGSQLVRIDPSSNTVVAELDLPVSGSSAFGDGDLVAHPNTTQVVYSYNDTVFVYSATATAPTAWATGSFYGIGVSPAGELYTAQVPSFTTGGTVQRYSAQGALLATYTVGIAPNGFVFNE